MIVGAVAQGSVGFGFGMLAAPVLALVDEELVPGAVLLLGLTVAVAIAWSERGALDWLGIRWALVGVASSDARAPTPSPRLDHDAMAIVLGPWSWSPSSSASVGTSARRRRWWSAPWCRG